ncbi:hypothetical protein HC023_01675 [Streptomyces sp. NEAU-H3]|nr:hypothetical protein [Streptomyces sp. NEAU-H3]
MKRDTLDFGSDLRRRRNEKKITLRKLSERVFCTPSHLSKVERGKTKANLRFGRLCDDALEAQGELAALLEDGEPMGERPAGINSISGLPASPSYFVGRPEELKSIADHLTGVLEGSLCVISGMAGVGKTALALQGAWAASKSFPDGCFFLDFSETSPHGTREVLNSLLQLTGVPQERLPSRPDALANLWRSRTRDKRLLLVLDNVHSAVDVAPLLSSGLGCKVIVTSQKRLSALDEATHVPVGVLTDTEARALFRTAGGERAACAPEAVVRAVVEYCGRLPLAVRIVAARLRSGSMRSVAELEVRLSHEAHRLELLDDGDSRAAGIASWAGHRSRRCGGPGRHRPASRGDARGQPCGRPPVDPRVVAPCEHAWSCTTVRQGRTPCSSDGGGTARGPSASAGARPSSRRGRRQVAHSPALPAASHP